MILLGVSKQMGWNALYWLNFISVIVFIIVAGYITWREKKPSLEDLKQEALKKARQEISYWLDKLETEIENHFQHPGLGQIGAGFVEGTHHESVDPLRKLICESESWLSSDKQKSLKEAWSGYRSVTYSDKGTYWDSDSFKYELEKLKAIQDCFS